MKTKIKNLAPYFFLLLPFLSISKHLDNDFWFTINHGRYILENGFTNIEPFTVHSDLVFSFEKWLTSVVFYSIYSKFGATGIMVLLYAMCALILIVFYKALMLVTDKNKPMSIIFATLFSAEFFSFFAVTRPQIFSYLILITEFYLCEKYVRSNRWQYLIALPILACLYMQFHSTMWPMFFIVLMPYLCDFKKIAGVYFLSADKSASDYKKLPLYIFALISGAALLINPYGYKSIFYFFNSLGVNNISLIQELQTPDVSDYVLLGIIPFCALLGYLIKTDRKQIPLRYLYFLIGTILMSAYAIRNSAYLMIFGTLVASYLFKDKIINLEGKKRTIIDVLGFITLTAFVLITISTPIDEYKKTLGYETLTEFNEKYGGTYEENQNVKLFTSFNTGSYAEWLGYKAYIDPRAEVFLQKINGKEDIIKEFKGLIQGSKHYKNIQDKYNFDYWLVENGGVEQTYISKDNDYKLLIKDEKYSIYEYTQIGSK